MSGGLFDDTEDQAALIEKTNAALQTSGSEGSEEDDEPEFTEEELALAGKMFFKGYADKEFTHNVLPGFSIVVSTLIGAEYDAIDTALLDFVEAKRDGDRSMVTDVILTTRRSIYSLAMSISKICGEEITDTPENRLGNLKNAVKQYEKYLAQGMVEEAKKQMSTVVGMIRERAFAITTKYSGHVIDWMNARRADFEDSVAEIVGRTGVVSKS